jgi:hypothetical protein
MRNNDKTLVIDYEGYMSTFDMILSSRVGFFLLLTTGMGFNLEGGVWNRGGGGERVVAMVVELRWRLGFGFKVKLAWVCVRGVRPILYSVF